MNIIETNNLTKNFGDTIAVNQVSIHVRAGEIYGFLGLNGAGKTTLIRLLLGMIKANSGTVSLFEKDLRKATNIWNEIGYLVETPNSYPNLSVKENLEVIFKLRGLKDKSQIKRIIDVLQLTPYQNKKAKYLSLGNNQRLGLAKALMHSPKLLILDEPINGLDPAGIVEIREFLKDLVQNHGTTIFLSSHILSEISKLATRIGIVHHGKLIKEINSIELEYQLIRKLSVKTNDNKMALKVLTDNRYSASENGKGIIEISDVSAIEKPELIAALLVSLGLPPKMLHVSEEDLESYFLRMIGN